MSLTKVSYSMIEGSPANILDFGASPTATAAQNAAAIVAAAAAARKVIIPSGSYDCTAFTLPDNTFLSGYGVNASKLIFTTGNAGTNDCINMGSNCVLQDLFMEPKVKNATYSVLPLLFPAGVFNYSTTIDAPRLATNCSAINCVFDGFYTGIAADSPGIIVDKCVSKGGYAALNFYVADGFSITNSVFYGGIYGCVALPSCRNGRIIGNYLYAPGSTGVNPGGSDAGGFEVKNLTISDNIIVGTNCVTCELGCESVTISNNVCLIANNDPAGGLGVGVATRSGGAFIREISITGNVIRPLDPTQPYSTGISVGIDDPTGPNIAVENVTITGNTIKFASQGIVAQAQISFFIGATITGNRILGGRLGMVLVSLTRFTVSQNVMQADAPTTVSNYYGIAYLDCFNGIIDNNQIRGYGQHFRQTGNANTNLFINNNQNLANQDGGAFQTFVNTGSGPAPMIRLTESMPAAFGTFNGTGSGVLTPLVQRGVTSITKTGTGVYAVVLQLDFYVTSDPVVVVTAGNKTSGGTGVVATVNGLSASGFTINTVTSSTGAAVDVERIMFTCIGI